VDWIRLAHDRDRWRAVVSAVMNLRILAPRSSLKAELGAPLLAERDSGFLRNAQVIQQLWMTTRILFKHCR
jgi:hypothetical protein